MLGRTMKPNRNVITFTRLNNSDDEPYKKQRTIGDPDICLNCPYPRCKTGECDRIKAKHKQRTRR